MSSQWGMLVSEFPEIGDRVRIAIRRGDSWIPICWVGAGNDGSVYFGLLIGRPAVGGRLMKQENSKEVGISYDDLEMFERDDVPSSSRVSFKASGEIHIGDEIRKGTPIESLSKPVQLCLFHQTHPDNIPLPEKKNPNDYDIGIEGYQFQDDKPLYGSLFVSPWRDKKSASPIHLKNMNESMTVALGFQGFSRAPDLLIQVVLGHGPSGPWPKMPGVVVLGRE
jgi:hypothetical protein